MDLVIWGHEHECLIEPVYNPETSFHVSQPGSSIATSLMPGEAKAKHVGLLTITGRDFHMEPIRLRTVRPFIMREIALADEKAAERIGKKANHRAELTRFLESHVEAMIAEAAKEWKEAQRGDEEEIGKPPLPLIRLRVDYTPPDGVVFDCENPQRFSNRFQNRVANTKDIISFHRKKTGNNRRAQSAIEPDAMVLASLNQENVSVEKIIREFLTAQSLTILPQNQFGDAVSQYVDKDDKHAMKSFVEQSLKTQQNELANLDDFNDDALVSGMEANKSNLEELFAAGEIRIKRKHYHPKPDDWDSDMAGHWEDDPRSIIRDAEDVEMVDAGDEDAAVPTTTTKAAPKSRGKAAAAKGKVTPAATKKAAPSKTGRGTAKPKIESDSDGKVDNAIELDSDSEPVAAKPASRARGGTKTAAPTAMAGKQRAPAREAATKSTRQTQINFSQMASQPKTNGRAAKVETISDDDIDDDDDAFEEAPYKPTSRKGARR